MTKDMRENTTRRVGQVKEVTSLANPIIKDIKALTQKKGREETGTFMAEGLKLVIDALELGWTIKTLVYAKAAKGKPLVEQAAVKTVASGGLVLTAYSIRASFYSMHELMREIMRGAGGVVASGELVIREAGLDGKTPGRVLSTSLFSRWEPK